MDAWKREQLWNVRHLLKKKSQALWQDIQAVDDPRAYYIPYENRDEAKRRVHFVDSMLKKHAKMFNSHHPVSYLVSNLNKHKEKLNPNQIAMDGLDEVKEIDELIRVLQDPCWYFEEVHHVLV